jgi:hypothetical protein
MLRCVLGSLLAVAGIVVTNGSATADMGVPGLRRAKPTHRISTREAFPDYVFVIYSQKSVYVKDAKTGNEERRSADEAEFIELTPEQPVMISVDASRIDRKTLIIVPRIVATPFKTALELAEASRHLKGAVWLELPHREDVPEWHSGEITIDYRVQRDAKSPDGRLEIVRTTWDQSYQCCVVGLCLPVAFSLGGLWLIRRWRRRRNSSRESGIIRDSATPRLP